MNARKVSAAALSIAAVLTIAGVAAAVTISHRTIEGEVLSHESIRSVSIHGSDVTHSSIRHASVLDSHVANAFVEAATVEDSYLEHLTIERATVRDSRVTHATLDRVALDDVTLCFARVVENDFNVGQCTLVSKHSGGAIEEHAWLRGDAPDVVGPGDHYDLEVRVADSGTLTVTNDPARINQFGFDTTAADSSVESLEVWADGEMLCEFDLGGTCDLEGEDRFSLRVNVAESGVIDGSTLGLVLDVNGHGLRPAMTSIDVVATELAFLPAEDQPFGPTLADNVGPLILTVPTDANGNVDRDIDVAVTVDVLEVDSGHDEGAGPKVGEPIDLHSAVHGDSEFFSDEPIQYVRPTSPAAHHPATLEFILRDVVGVEGITFGAAGFHATHVTAQSPYYTKLQLHASATNANGDELTAGPLVLEYERLPEEERPVDHPFGPFDDKVFPGEGTLRVEFVDGDGNPVNREAGWALVIHETPESHNVTLRIEYEEDGGSVDEQPLAASPRVGLPFGDFVDHEYIVCLEHDGDRDCANDGDLIRIETGETTTVRIVVE